MCDKLRKEAKTMLMLEDDEDEEREYRYARGGRGRGRGRGGRMTRYGMRTMYEPEKILVQNAGIDPGVAALLQNANKGNMDPAALMAMMNNGGFGGNGGW